MGGGGLVFSLGKILGKNLFRLDIGLDKNVFIKLLLIFYCI